jgi:hypothetical protein
LGSVNDGMDSLEQTTSNWLGDVNKFVGQQKKNAVTGCKLIGCSLTPLMRFLVIRSTDFVPR